ncbi:MAG: hypothetical protein N2Z22_03705 [Turneriella sp.]|nr:hypothetical protein [Turneriella sp.]
MKKKFLAILITLAACQRKPEVVFEAYFFVGAPDEQSARRQNPELVLATTELVNAIIDHNPEKILEFVHPVDGAITDAKKFQSSAQIRDALYNPETMLYRVLWDDGYWQKTAPEDNIRSYRTVLRKAGKIRLALFWYSPTECEVRLDFPGRPPMGVMGNLIFRKRDGRWYLMNFF